MTSDQRRGMQGDLARRLGLASWETLRVIDRALQRLELADARGHDFPCDVTLGGLRGEVDAMDRAAAERDAAEAAERAREWGASSHETRVSKTPQRIAHEHDAAPYDTFDVGGEGG